MKRKLTLSQYVKRRNGVPLGGSGSLSNMLQRSLGSGSFSGFWQYWNPIWGYYLSRYIFSPLNTRLPTTVAVMLTFITSGLLHDFAASLIKMKLIFVTTPWFVLMGFTVVMSERLNISYSHFSWFYRAVINVFIIVINLFLALFLKALL